MTGKIAWVLGASGFWGQKTALSLLRKDYQILALCRRQPDALLEWAEAQGKHCQWQPLDLASPDFSFIDQHPAPAVFFQCAVTYSEDLAYMMQVNAIGPIQLMELVLPKIQPGGKAGVFLGQNGRLGLPGLGKFSATQGALWTWAEAQQRTLKQDKSSISLSLVFPPRAPSQLQQNLAGQLRKPPKVKLPDNADSLVEGVLTGKRRVGRKPLIAGLSTLIT